MSFVLSPPFSLRFSFSPSSSLAVAILPPSIATAIASDPPPPPPPSPPPLFALPLRFRYIEEYEEFACLIEVLVV
ncbi:hypothetical protein RIF29_20684 [Crotalaria pallida]|uniref:Uncharacterized protein n=1 Tax=Crotalaria pallida TaxID=3830 RepID=A0AAN9F1Z7_CROPI